MKTIRNSILYGLFRDESLSAFINTDVTHIRALVLKRLA